MNTRIKTYSDMMAGRSTPAAPTKPSWRTPVFAILLGMTLVFLTYLL
jgi:hypothetical protein